MLRSCRSWPSACANRNYRGCHLRSAGAPAGPFTLCAMRFALDWLTCGLVYSKICREAMWAGNHTQPTRVIACQPDGPAMTAYRYDVFSCCGMIGQMLPGVGGRVRETATGCNGVVRQDKVCPAVPFVNDLRVEVGVSPAYANAICTTRPCMGTPPAVGARLVAPRVSARASSPTSKNHTCTVTGALAHNVSQDGGPACRALRALAGGGDQHRLDPLRGLDQQVVTVAAGE